MTCVGCTSRRQADKQARTHLEAGLDGAEVHGVGHDLVVVLQAQRRRVHGRVEDPWGWVGVGVCEVWDGVSDGKPVALASLRCALLTLVGGVAHEAGQKRADGARKGLGPERHQVPRQVALLLIDD